MGFNIDIYSSPEDQRNLDQVKTDLINNGAIFEEEHDIEDELFVPGGCIAFYQHFKPVNSCENYKLIGETRLGWASNSSQVGNFFRVISNSDLCIFFQLKESLPPLKITSREVLYFIFSGQADKALSLLNKTV